MRFVAAQPEAYLGTVVGDGHCVAYVRAAANLPATTLWLEGEPVWQCAEQLKPGTAIATFNERGKYGNATDGSSHAAIFMGPDEYGLKVLDQWRLHPVTYRVIRPKDGHGPAVDDADRYCVIEVIE